VHTKAYTTISFRGDREDVRLLNVLAATRGVKIGELVREAVDMVYGDDLRRCADFFVASGEQQNAQVSNSSSHNRESSGRRQSKA
jgi:hypothetical protein